MATPFHDLHSEDDWQEARTRSEEEPVLIYKHSTTCPISAGAQDRLQELTEEDDPPVYRVVVQKARDVSNAIEEALGVRHETPQAILLRGGQPVYDASHRKVTAEAVREAMQNAEA